MYNLILIDDEFSATNLLKNYIDWSAYNLQIIACFNDSAEALSFISENAVDAVITDICMPDMDGIEFGKYCKEHYPDLIIGFISAHRNFEYAYLAANLNVAGYVLKPIIRADIITMCQTITSRLDKQAEDKKKQFSNETLNYQNLHYQLTSQKILLDMSYNNLTNPHEIEQLFHAENIGISTEMPCSIWDLTINNYSNYVDNPLHPHHVVTLYNAINTVVVRNYNELVVLPFLGSQKHLLFVAVNTAQDQAALSKADAPTFDTIKNRLSYYLDIDVSISVIHTFQSLKQLIGFSPDIHSIESNLADDPIEQSVAYVQTHFSSIYSVEDAANHVHLSTAYFGRLFKNKTGKSFNQFLNEQRIEQAKKLLQSSTLTIASIASSCGFRNEPYFYTVFNEFVGCTPSQYRETRTTAAITRGDHVF